MIAHTRAVTGNSVHFADGLAREAYGLVREMRPHLFMSNDRSRDLAEFVFASSDRTR